MPTRAGTGCSGATYDHIEYQHLSKNERSNVNEQTQLNPCMRHNCLWIVRFILPRQILGHSCVDPPLLVSLICDSRGLHQRGLIEIILELQSCFMRDNIFPARSPLTSTRDPCSLSIFNIVEQFLHRNSDQGHYKAFLPTAQKNILQSTYAT